MTYFVQFNPSSGCLIDISETDSFNITDANLVIELREGDYPDTSLLMWDPNNREFIRRSNNKDKIFTKKDFLLLFTMHERSQILISEDTVIKDFMMLLTNSGYVDLNDQLTKQGIQYLVMIGILTPERMTEILN